jgi:hypothetical protein
MTDKELTILVERYCTCENFRRCFVAKIDAFGIRWPFKKTVEIAAKGKEVSGTGNRHLNRLRICSLDSAVEILTGKTTQLKRCKNFDELHQILTHLVIHISGIGTVYCYDVALRIGVANGFLPEKVFLPSTPVRNAAHELNLEINDDKTINFGTLRLPLKKLKPYVVEDFLCIFEKKLKSKMNQNK